MASGSQLGNRAMLYFEIRANGHPVDPLLQLPSPLAQSAHGFEQKPAMPFVPPQFFQDHDILREHGRLELLGLLEELFGRQAGDFDKF